MEIREVFLGATVRDLGHYRSNVQEALRRARAEIYLQEDWSEAAAEVVDLSRRRLESSDAYMLLLGYRYGSIPTKSDASVTEIECRYAFSLWEGVAYPPIFLFVPEPGKLAAKELEALAEEVLAEEYLDEAERAKNRCLQTKFRSFVLNEQRFCRSFATLNDLREWAITSIYNYRQDIYKHAIHEKDRALANQRAKLAPADLGGLGRSDQLRALRHAWRGLGKQRDAPGMCVVVHGAYSTGQAEFLEFLKSWEEWESSVGGLVVAPSSDTVDAEAIARTALAAMRPDSPADNSLSAVSLFLQLAQALLAASTDERQVLFVGGLDRMTGGLTGFHHTFWLPLYEALRAVRSAGNNRPERATIVVAWGERLPQPPPDGIAPPAPANSYENTEFALLVPLPELGDFTRDHVEDWLRDWGLRGATLEAMTDRVLEGGGEPGTVYSRLRNESFLGRLPRGKIA